MINIPLRRINTPNTFVYFANVSNLNIQENISLLPEFRRKKADILALEKDKKLSIGVYLLLKKVLKLHDIKINDYKWNETEFGKPFLEGYPLHFSLSHSGDFVCVAVSKKPVGIDIQFMKDVDPKIYKLVFNKVDQDFYDSCEDKKQAFYQIWTYKEALLKMSGEGITKSLKNVEIDYTFDTRLFSYNGLKNYQISICTNDECVNVCKELKI